MAKIKAEKKLSDEVLASWTVFEAMRLNSKVKTDDLKGMQRIFRAFAMLVLQQQPHNDKITAGNQVLIKFPNSDYRSKSEYITKMSQPSAWLEDAALYPALEVLGYQPIIHLVGTELPPYAPFVQQESDEPMKIDIVNYGAKQGGTHWECSGFTNPGGGDCGAYSVAQQMMNDYEKIIFQIPESNIAEMQEIIEVATEQPKTIPKIPYQQESNAVTREISEQFKAHEETAEKRRTIIASKLKEFSTEQLAALYKDAMDKDPDYLSGRMRAILNETDIDISKIVATGNLDKDNLLICDIINEELIHALSMEAWRDQRAFKRLEQVEQSSFQASSVYHSTSNERFKESESGDEMAKNNTPRISF